MKFKRVGKIKDLSYITADKIAKILEADGYKTEKFITYANKSIESIDCNLTVYSPQLRSVCAMSVNTDGIDLDELSL